MSSLRKDDKSGMVYVQENRNACLIVNSAQVELDGDVGELGSRDVLTWKRLERASENPLPQACHLHRKRVDLRSR